MLDRLVETGFNTIFLQVRSRGTLIYSSDIEGMNPAFVSPRSGYRLSYDPLDFAIEECNQRGLSLHVWMAVMPVGSEKERKMLPKEAFLNQQGKACIHYKGQWYMDPSDPETAIHLNRIVTELLSRYRVSGIHLDYIRYPDRSELFPDRATYESKHLAGEGLGDWRRRNIQEIVGAIHLAIMQSQQPTLLSAAVLGSYRELLGDKRRGWTAYAEAYQDPVAWVKAKAIDFIVPMLYYQNHHFSPYLQDWIKVLPHTPVVIGLGAYRIDQKEGNWAPQVIQEQIKEVRQYGEQLGGVVLFRAKHALENRYRLTPLLATAWRKNMPLPFRNLHPTKQTKAYPIYNVELIESDEGLLISWEVEERGTMGGESSTFTIYLTHECNEPDEKKDLQLITTQQKVLIPWGLIPEESTTYIKIGRYSPLTLQEYFEHPGILYYRSAERK